MSSLVLQHWPFATGRVPSKSQQSVTPIMRSHTHTHTRTHAHAHTDAHAHTRTDIYTHTQTCTYAHMQTLTCTCRNTQKLRIPAPKCGFKDKNNKNEAINPTLRRRIHWSIKRAHRNWWSMLLHAQGWRSDLADPIHTHFLSRSLSLSLTLTLTCYHLPFRSPEHAFMHFQLTGLARHIYSI